MSSSPERSNRAGLLALSDFKYGIERSARVALLTWIKGNGQHRSSNGLAKNCNLYQEFAVTRSSGVK